MEVKAGSVIDVALSDEIERFGRKIDRLRDRLDVLAQALATEMPIVSVSGLFISLADLAGFEHRDSSVYLWDYDRFVHELTKAGLTSRVLKVLERSFIVHSFSKGDFPYDPFFTGLNASR